MKKTTMAIFSAAVLIPLFAAAQEGQTPPPAAKQPPARMLARESLGLTSDQEKAIEEFRKARMVESQAFREEMMKLRGEMRELAQDPKTNEAKIDALIDRSAKFRAERAKTAFKNRGKMEKIFTPEQLEKMKAFRGRLMDRPGLAGLGRMGFYRMGFRGPGMGRFRGPGLGRGPMGRFRPLRHRPFLWRRW